MRKLRLVLIASAALLLTACGGGGNNGAQDQPSRWKSMTWGQDKWGAGEAQQTKGREP
jgi:outer membrane biogenesis lipoprotein LolB